MSDGEHGNVRWYLVFWLFVLSAVSFLDRVNISVAGSSIAEEYHLSKFSSAGSSAPSCWDMRSFRLPADGLPTGSARGLCSPSASFGGAFSRRLRPQSRRR